MHLSVGVRSTEFAQINRLFKFWPAGALLKVQNEHSAGNFVGRHLSDT